MMGTFVKKKSKGGTLTIGNLIVKKPAPTKNWLKGQSNIIIKIETPA